MLQVNVPSTTGLWSFPPPMVPSREKSKHAGLAQEIGFAHNLLWLVKCCAHVYDMTGVQCVSDWPIISISPGGLLLEVPHLLAVQVLVLWVGLQTSK
jgi:hypothetical protein